MSKWIVDIHGEIEGDYELIKKYEDPRVGIWVHREDIDFLDENKVIHKHFMCQDCGFIHDFIDGRMGQYNYCPNCGMKMNWSTGSEG